MKRLRKINSICLLCGVEFHTPLSQLALGNGKYCSHSCSSKCIKHNNSKENNPNWRGGLSYQPYLYSRKFYKRYPEKEKAHQKLYRAIRRGKIKGGLTCVVCGSTSKKLDGHHEDYSKPLEVIWLCRQDHVLLHRLLTIRKHTFAQ